MELTGTIKKIGEIQTFASGFQKREIILLTEEQYPQPINIELLSDNVDLSNNFKEGDKVKIGINIRGREWVSPQGETKYFNSISGWRIDMITENSGRSKQEEQPESNPQYHYENPFDKEDDDDLPF